MELIGTDVKMLYTYSADGQKHRTQRQTLGADGVWSTTYTHYYLPGLEIRNDEIEALNHADGRIVKKAGEPRDNPASYTFQYTIADHLGNTRVLFADENKDGLVAASDILQQNHYYPFGLEQTGTWNTTVGGTDMCYRYNGKEFSEELGLYDYGARYYDPAIARWGQVDPSAEQYLAYSPYNYTLNNPILYIDPDGRRVEYGDNVSREDKKAFKKRIRTLRKQSKTFKSLWKDLKKSKHTHTISFTDTPSGTSTTIKDLDGYRSGENRGTNITVNLDDSSAEGVEVGNEIAIGHEVGHAWRADQGKTVIADEPRQMTADELLANPNGPIEQLQQYEEAASAAQINEEVQTSHIENIIRSEVSASSGRDIPLRKQYSNLTKAVRTRFGVSRKNYNAPTIRPGYNYSGKVEHYSKLKSGN